MCVTCGCSDGAKVTTHEHVHADGTRHTHIHDHAHDRAHIHDHDHDHDHAHHHEHGHAHHHDHGHDPVHALSISVRDTETLRLETQILGKNQLIAERNRGWLAGRHVLALNLLSSPGAGKTTLLERTLTDLNSQIRISVIEGDQATSNDAERIRATGARAVQINTGTGCHLEADMLQRALELLKPEFGSLLLIENVGNLVCPALFDLGERGKVVILSVTEGDDKPLKYPHMFAAADVLVLCKIDLLPHVRFDADRAIQNALTVNPQLTVFRLSAYTGEGMTQWYDWLKHELANDREAAS